jgi:hypothetical protein
MLRRLVALCSDTFLLLMSACPRWIPVRLTSQDGTRAPSRKSCWPGWLNLPNLYPRRIFGIGLTVRLLEVLLATLIGAYLYREPKGPDHMSHAGASDGSL